MTTPVPSRSSEQVSDDLASALAQMSQVLLAVQTGDTVVNLVTALAVETLPGTVGAGVTVVDPDGKHTRAASNALVEQADQLQYANNAGPCLTAWRDQVPVQIDEVSTEDRWPEWSAAVASLGVRSMLSVPMLSAGRSLGAIKVYSDRPNAYDPRSVTILELFAQQAAVLLSNNQTVADARKLSSQLTAALDDRDVIGQATGVLLAQGAADVPAALEALRSATRRAGTSLHTVAHGIVDGSVARTRGSTWWPALTIADQADEGFPHANFEAARIQGKLSVQDLWVRYLAVGGSLDIFDIDAHLQGVIALEPFEQDTLAWALNERLDELAAAAKIPYLQASQPIPASLQGVIDDLLGDGWDPGADTGNGG